VTHSYLIDMVYIMAQCPNNGTRYANQNQFWLRNT
jgi:hypothetical protein